MTPTVYQKPEIRDANDNIIQQGAFGKNTALANATNDGWIDYVANDLEFLYDIAKDEVVPVPSLPASGQTNKTYLLTTTGVSYRWSGTEWVAVSSSEAVGRAESAANLAEQWATKTDGTVDGTEYSAKYYAEQAEASADDAQDTADDMADHLAQIDKNTGGVAKNSKRISNIEKLLQGNLYDYDTDDDSAYTKTVPAGALPYAGIEQIGGKTLVWNQLVKDGNFALGDTTYWKKQGSNASDTIEFTNGVATVTFGGNSSVFNPAITQQTEAYIQAVQGHKYLIKAEAMADFTVTGLYFSSPAMGGSFTIDHTAAKDTWISLSRIITAQADGRLFGYIGALGRTDMVQGSKLNFRNIIMIDLTLMFGSGNEPSTVAEFEAMFPADYYPYNAGTLLSAGVTGVESVSANLFNVTNDSGTSTTAGITYTYDKATGIVTANGTAGTNADIVFILANPINASAGESITVSLHGSNVANFIVYFRNPTGAYFVYGVTSVSDFGRKITFNIADDCIIDRILFRLTNGAVATNSQFRIQVERGSTATSYVPYFDITTPIPAEVQALEGYGWSTNAVSNYIDYESKKFIKNVASVDLGTLNWTKWTGNQKGFYALVSGSKGTQNGQIETAICQKYVGDMYSSVVNGTHDKIFNISNNTKFIYLYDSAYQEDTATNFKASLSGVTLYYELATPVETDISQYLTDNLIEVGAGGTLTFPNQNGADYHISVPSDVTYMIDLQEAIENGN